MENTETIKPFSSIGAPGKFDLEKAKIYVTGLNQTIYRTTGYYREQALKKERDKIREQIAYYEENKIAYDL